jgi:hypothetical protein
MEKPSRDSYCPSDFLQWRNAGTLEIAPKFQRREVWKTGQKSFLIDTLLRGMPVPPLYLRNRFETVKRSVLREVVDGQQRLRSVLGYIDGEFALARTLDAPYAGKEFSDLTDGQRTAILSYRFICETFDGISDREVLEVFQRLNTHSVPLSKQELRNGRFFGRFKQCCYNLAHQHLEFWRRYHIFTEAKIARMLEVELTSELIIAQLMGMQDKKNSIDAVYDEYDNEFREREACEHRFSSVIDQITASLGDVLANCAFRRPPFFYTLFCVVYHRTYGLPDIPKTLTTPKKKLTALERSSLKEAVEKLSDILYRIASEVPPKYNLFVDACSQQTDNIQPRTVRFETLYGEAFHAHAPTDAAL